jgi:hypothetical protein
VADFRKLSNGFLIAPQRGTPPEPPEGYERMHGEQYVFAPIMTICKYRERRLVKRGGCCGGTLEKFWCLLKKTYVSRYFCKECKDAE